jgi:hypothetical protein
VLSLVDYVMCDMMAAQEGSAGGESGQAALLLLVILSTFLIATLVFAVDLSNMWFHKQSVQAAADAACQAAAADMLVKASGGTPPQMGFTVGTPGDCSSTPSTTMCAYARINGYSGTGLNPSAASSAVSWTFPSMVSGVTAPPVSLTASPFLQVTVVENIRTWFLGMVGRPFQNVAAACTCGLISAKAAPPLVVLNPTVSSAFSINSNATVQLISGAQRSIEVNSSSSSATAINGVLDTSQAGPSGTGGDVAVVGGPGVAPASYLPGTTGHWLSPAIPLPNPYASVPAPMQPATALAPQNVSYGIDGCPDPTGCVEYSPGYYSADIHPTGTAIFKAGLYYMDANLRATASGTTLRNAYSGSSPTPQTDGVTFYFHTGSPTLTAAPKAYPSIDHFSAYLLQCNLSSPLPAGVPTTLDGDILYGPCMTMGTYNYSPSTDSLSSAGSRGLVMFSSLTNLGITPALAGGGALAFAGTLYFHSNAYDDTVKLSGVSGSSTEVVGSVVTDLLTVTGQGSITMALNPVPSISISKVSLLQ